MGGNRSLNEQTKITESKALQVYHSNTKSGDTQCAKASCKLLYSLHTGNDNIISVSN